MMLSIFCVHCTDESKSFIWPDVRALLEHQYGDVDAFLAEVVLGS